jgi:putative tryptophan/tyrosine transport system substrate-binding protein
MKAKILVYALPALILATIHLAEAQQPAKIPRIGVLYPGSSGPSPQLDGFRHGLRELGYAEGENIAIDYRFAEGKLDRLPDLAAELVRLKVDVIVAAGGTPAILAAKKATSTIPIVFPTVGDPVALGIVDSLARPGGNITGLTIRTYEFTGKMLELLKEVVPRTKRVAVLGQEANAANARDFKDLQAVAPALGLQLHQIDVRSADDFESAFSKMTGTVRDTGLFLQAAPLFANNGKRIAELATKHRLPAMSFARELTEAGILTSYGVDRFDLGRRAATYVDKILKGAKPADLPVQQPTKFEFVINLKTAKQIGLTIPPNVLARADRVIK